MVEGPRASTMLLQTEAPVAVGLDVTCRGFETIVRHPVYHPRRKMVDRLKKNPLAAGS